MVMRTRLGVVPLLASLSFAGLGCAAGQPATPSPGATTVKVTLQEWSVGTDVTTVSAGPITFLVTNQGPDDVHEFVVIKTDLSFVDLPTDANGAVDEAGGDMEVIGEIEDIAIGTTDGLDTTLGPGAYVLICNIYDETEDEAHYAMGMRNSFTVTQ